MNPALKIVGGVVALVLFAYFAVSIHHAFDAHAFPTVATPAVVLATVAAGALCFVVVPLSAWGWQRLLTRGDMPTLPLATLMGIMGATQFAKYLPGNIAQHAGRAALSLSHGLRPTIYLVSIVLEIGLSILACLVVAACLFAVSPHFLDVALHLVPASRSVWMAALVAACLAFPMAVVTIERFAKRRGEASARTGGASVAAWQNQLPAFAAYSANYLLIGLGFWLVAYAAGISGHYGYAALTAAFSLSWLVGMLAPGVPAGLGVREGMMLLMLGGGDSGGVLLGSILAMRVASVSADAAWFFVGGWLLNRQGRGAVG